MKRFRDQLEREGLAEKKVHISLSRGDRCTRSRSKMKTCNKRLSLEGTKLSPSTHRPQTPSAQTHAVSPLADPNVTPRAKPTQSEPVYVVEHIDVTEEVNKRLRESRLQRLMETPSTAQKRKFDTYEDTMAADGVDVEEDGNLRSSDYERTPVKRLRITGTFEASRKRKENESVGGGGDGRGGSNNDDERLKSRTDFKRRKL